MVHLLLRRGASPKWNQNPDESLGYSVFAEVQTLSTAMLLFEHGAEVTPQTPYNVATLSSSEFLDYCFTIANPLVVHHHNFLHNAVCAGRIDDLQVLLKRGQDIDGRLVVAKEKVGWTPLLSACMDGHISHDAVKFLAENAADLEVVNDEGQTVRRPRTSYCRRPRAVR